MTKKPIAAAVEAAVQAIPAAPVAEAPATPAEPKSDLILKAPTPDLNPRNRVMAEIAARSNAQADENAKETAETVDDDGNEVEPPPSAEEPAASAPQENAPEAPAAPAAAVPAASAAPAGVDLEAEYEIEIEGRPTKVKGSQIIDAGRRTLQKESAADYRLQIATEALEHARRQAAAPAAPEAPAEPAPLNDLQLAELVQFGSKEQAAAAIAELRRRDPSAVTTEGLQQFMSAQLPKLVDRQLEFREATRFVQDEYGDLLGDPYLKQMFFWKEDQMRKAGDTRGYIDLYKDIGEGLRKHFNRAKAPGSAPVAPTSNAAPAAPTRDQRLAAKAAAPAAPKLASARLDGGAGLPKPKTREEIIEGMRRSRGQDSINRI